MDEECTCLVAPPMPSCTVPALLFVRHVIQDRGPLAIVEDYCLWLRLAVAMVQVGSRQQLYSLAASICLRAKNALDERRTVCLAP